jgi:hypothetical protein
MTCSISSSLKPSKIDTLALGNVRKNLVVAWRISILAKFNPMQATIESVTGENDENRGSYIEHPRQMASMHLSSP